jgi:hypothetical protein
LNSQDLYFLVPAANIGHSYWGLAVRAISDSYFQRAALWRLFYCVLRGQRRCERHPNSYCICKPKNQIIQMAPADEPCKGLHRAALIPIKLARACRAGWTIQKTFTLCVETVFGAVRRACLCVFDLSELEKFSRKEVRKLHLEVQSILTPGETK